MGTKAPMAQVASPIVVNPSNVGSTGTTTNISRDLFASYLCAESLEVAVFPAFDRRSYTKPSVQQVIKCYGHLVTDKASRRPLPNFPLHHIETADDTFSSDRGKTFGRGHNYTVTMGCGVHGVL